MLVSPRISTYLEKAFVAGSICGGHPYKWDKNLQRPQIGSQHQQRLWKLNMILGLSHAGFVCIRSIQMELQDDQDTKYQRMFLRALAAFYSLAVVLHLQIILKRKEIIDLINQFMNAFVDFETRSGSHEQISSLIPDLQSKFKNVMVVILNAMIFTYINYIFYSSAAALVQSSFSLSTILVLFGEINPKTASITHVSLRQENQMLQISKVLTLLMMLFNEILTDMMIPAVKGLLIIWCVLCTYGAIKMDGISSVTLSLVSFYSFIFLVTMFMFLAEVQVRSSAVKRFWKSVKTQNPWLKRSLNAITVSSVKLRGAYIVDRPM
ncbi:unnamed protein product, partial [Allacma fusca]